MNKLVVFSLLFLVSSFKTYGTELTEIINGTHRDMQSKARDEYRHPLETLQFFGVTSQQTVLEIWPGTGWYSEILAPFLKNEGKLIAATYRTDQQNSEDKRLAHRSRIAIEYRERFSDPQLFGQVDIIQFSPDGFNKELVKANVDTILLIRLLHVWDEFGFLQQGLRDMYKTLKPGGVLGVVQHRANSTSKIASTSVDGYLSEEYIIKAAESVGFKLLESSEINANPKDTKDHPRGVYTLPPTLAMGEYDKEKYVAIGESDRMTLKFIKAK